MNNNLELLLRLKYVLLGTDGVYSEKMKERNLNIVQLGIIHILNNDNPHSQKEIAKKLCSPVSTINTIIKKWEKAEVVKLIPIEGKKREKNVYLTQKGLDIKKQIIDCLYKAEEEAMKKTLEKYSSEFIDALEYYGECLKSSLKNLK